MLEWANASLKRFIKNFWKPIKLKKKILKITRFDPISHRFTLSKIHLFVLLEKRILDKLFEGH